MIFTIIQNFKLALSVFLCPLVITPKFDEKKGLRLDIQQLQDLFSPQFEEMESFLGNSKYSSKNVILHVCDAYDIVQCGYRQGRQFTAMMNEK